MGAGVQVSIDDYYDKDYGVGDSEVEKKNKLDFLKQLAASDPDSVEEYGVTFDMEVVGNPGVTVDLVKDGGQRVMTGAD